MVQPRDDHLVAGPKCSRDRSGKVEQERRRVGPEDDLMRIAAEEVRARLARVRDQVVDLDARRERAVRVRGAGPQAASDRVDHGVGKLRSAGCVGPHVRAAVGTKPSERGEPRPDRSDVERR